MILRVIEIHSIPVFVFEENRNDKIITSIYCDILYCNSNSF